MKYLIENEFLKVAVNGDGASLTSLIYKPTGEERLWQGGEWWKGQDVVIFPILGHAGSFVAKGREYNLKAHGIIRYATLFPKNIGGDALTLAFHSNEETLKNYPYEFDFEIKYELIKNSLKVSYFVRSLSGTMPFYIGGHPALKAPNGQMEIVFENFEAPLLYPVGCGKAYSLGGTGGFVADKELFKEHKTYQLGSLSGGAVTAKTDDGYSFTFNSDCPLYAFWSNPDGGDYVCVEPWWGINDYPEAPRELTLKPFINFDMGEGSRFSYTLTVEKK